MAAAVASASCLLRVTARKSHASYSKPFIFWLIVVGFTNICANEHQLICARDESASAFMETLLLHWFLWSTTEAMTTLCATFNFILPNEGKMRLKRNASERSEKNDTITDCEWSHKWTINLTAEPGSAWLTFHCWPSTPEFVKSTLKWIEFDFGEICNS